MHFSFCLNNYMAFPKRFAIKILFAITSLRCEYIPKEIMTRLILNKLLRVSFPSESQKGVLKRKNFHVTNYLF